MILGENIFLRLCFRVNKPLQVVFREKYTLCPLIQEKISQLRHFLGKRNMFSVLIVEKKDTAKDFSFKENMEILENEYIAIARK